MALTVPVEQIQARPPSSSPAQREVFSLPVELLRPVIRIAHRQSGLRVPERIIFDYELVWVLHGAGQFVIDGRACAFHSNDLLLVPPFVPHRFECPEEAGSGEHIAVHFDFAPDVPPYRERPASRRPYEVRLTYGYQLPRLLSLDARPQIARALQDVVHAHHQMDPLAPVLASARLLEALVCLLRLSEQRAGTEPFCARAARHRVRIDGALAYMKAHLAEPITVATLAEHTHLSSSRLTALFRQVTGYPPMEYLRRLRVQEARRLLARPELSVKQVAALVGFPDSLHFSRVFRRLDGLSPTQYRDALLGVADSGHTETGVTSIRQSL
ncbi:MAG: AraC family transcriptional regulator [Chloroherpetonaceae bacterium]|nr:AraC family transcriptional regulator [Chthonomonadaceae bacterium]MDW8207876.1 AraC family transcriptional regulator [Chloroherpetonaceae bacterium]